MVTQARSFNNHQCVGKCLKHGNYRVSNTKGEVQTPTDVEVFKKFLCEANLKESSIHTSAITQKIAILSPYIELQLLVMN